MYIYIINLLSQGLGMTQTPYNRVGAGHAANRAMNNDVLHANAIICRE